MGSDPNQEEYIMSEQEKNTTPAQNAAPAAPKPPKIDNAALKKAAAALREENNPQNFNAVINLMMRGVFLAPAKIEIGENPRSLPECPQDRINRSYFYSEPSHTKSHHSVPLPHKYPLPLANSRYGYI